MMGGVDRDDQELMFYVIIRKQQVCYYKKAFRLFVQNSQRTSTTNSVEHAERVFVELQTTGSARKPGRRSAARRHPGRLTDRHFPEHIPANVTKKEPTRMCVVCCSRRKPDGKKVRRESRYYCPQCDVGLCVEPCFKEYHTQPNY